MRTIRSIIFVMAACASAQAGAGDRLEYGVSFNDTGIVDHVSGLEWLDSAATDGGLDDLLPWLDAGWRIATEEEFFFLATREPGQTSGGSATSNLNAVEFHALTARLSITPDVPVSGPWLCRPFGDLQVDCASTTAFGGQFGLNLQASSVGVGDGTDVEMSVFLTEVPLYGRFDCDEDPPCTYEGRSLLVRAVSVPAPDTDNDGFVNTQDNCLLVANLDQRDTDGDGIGNFCDPDLNGDCEVNLLDLFLLRPLFFGADAGADFDGSGMVNFADLFILKTFYFGSPGPSGLPDVCDAGP